MLASGIIFAINNFALSMFLLAAIFILLHRSWVGKSLPESEIIFRWIAFFALGLTGIFSFITHVFYPETSARLIGWQPSPFQFEVAMADLAIGVLGILSFKNTFGFRVATVVASICFLGGDAIGHLYQMYSQENFSPGNAGSWFWMDVIIPLILLLSLLKLRPGRPLLA